MTINNRPAPIPTRHTPLLTDVMRKGLDASQCAVGMLDSLEVVFEGIRSLARESGREQIAQLAMVGSELVDSYHALLKPMAKELQEMHDDAWSSRKEGMPVIEATETCETVARTDADYHSYQIKQLSAQLEILHAFALRRESESVLTDGIGVALDLAARLECEVAEATGMAS